MRRIALIGILPLLLLSTAGSAFAQVPASRAPDTPVQSAPSEPEAAPAVLPSPPATPPAPGWSLDLLIGLPTGLRAQARLGESAWVVEGIAGLYVILPMLGGGVRHCFTALSGEHNALCLSPGIDAYLVQEPFTSKRYFGCLGADTDLFWRHTYTRCLQSDLGIKLGAGALLDGSHREVVVPLVSLFGGLRF